MKYKTVVVTQKGGPEVLRVVENTVLLAPELFNLSQKPHASVIASHLLKRR